MKFSRYFGLDIEDVRAFNLGVDLFEACVAGDLDRVEEVLTASSSAALSWREPRTGRTPLHGAVESGKIEIIRRLLAAGFDPNAADNISRTPLHAAVESGNIEIVRHLLTAGSDPNAADSSNDTVLHLALHCALENVPLVEGERKKVNLEVVRLLLDAGADPRVRGNEQTDAFGLARLYLAKEAERFLEKYMR